MKHSKISPRVTRALIAVAISACFSPLVFSLPVAPTVVNGSASFAQNGNTLTVTNSNQAIINWQSFSIGNKETTRFVQSSANSSVLNRVLGNDPSQLLGALQSNGRVFLINPAGVLIGQGARVDVAGFAASTLNLSNNDFLANRLRFTENSGAGKVQNLGEITTPSGGSVYLVAPQVENNGVITSPNGEVLLAAGQRIELVDTATPGVRIEVVGSEGGATNLGSITADAGRIGIAGVLVKNSGTINASSVVNEGGRIFLKARSDALLTGNSQISATGSKGGQVEVLGNHIALTENAQIDASGQNGGGSVLVGGDYQGKNSKIQNAKHTYFGSAATIKADAIMAGNGGKVIAWADDTTKAYGSISAKGGITDGDGGFVEVSGKQYLVYQALTDTHAPFGKTGTLLLDPTSISLTAGAGTDSTSTLYGDNVKTNLGSSNLILQTSSGGTGNITFTAGTYDFSGATAANSLKLLAYSDGGSSSGNISIPSGTLITMKTGAALTMVAGWDGASTTSPATVTGFGTISVVDVVTAVSGLSAFAGNNITTTGSGKLASGSGTGVTLKAGGDISVTLDGDVSAETTTAGKTIAISDPGAIIVKTAGIKTNNGDITLTPTGTTSNTLNGPINAGTGTLTLSSCSGCTFTVPSGSSLAAGAYTLSAGTLALAGSATLGSYSQTGDGTLTGAGTLTTTTSFDKTGLTTGTFPSTLSNLSITKAGTLTPGSLTAAGPLTIKATAIDFEGTSVLTGTAVDIQADTFSNQSGTAGVTSSTSLSIAPKSTTTSMKIGTSSDPGGVFWLSNSLVLTPGTSLRLGSESASYSGTTTLIDSSTIASGKDLHLRAGSSASSGSLIIAASSPITWGGSETIKLIAGSGGIQIGSSITNTPVTGTLSIDSGGVVTGTTAGVITAAGLAVKSLGNVALDSIAHSVGKVAANLGNASNQDKYFRFKTASGLEVATVDSISGITSSLSAGNYTSDTVDGVLSLESGGSLTQAAGALLSGRAVVAISGSASTDKVLLTNANPTGILAGTASGGGFSYTSSSPIFLTAIKVGANTKAGISTTNNGSITLTTTGASISADYATYSLAKLTTTGASTLNASNGSVINAAVFAPGATVIEAAAATTSSTTAADTAAAKLAADAAAAKLAADAAAAKLAADTAAAKLAADTTAAKLAADAAAAKLAADETTAKLAAEATAAKVTTEAAAALVKIEIAKKTTIETTLTKLAVVETVTSTQTKTPTSLKTPPQTVLATEGASSGGTTAVFSGKTIGGGEGEFGAAALEPKQVLASAPNSATTAIAGKNNTGGPEFGVSSSELKPVSDATSDGAAPVAIGKSSDGGDSSSGSKSGSDSKSGSSSTKESKEGKEGKDDTKIAKKKPAQCSI